MATVAELPVGEIAAKQPGAARVFESFGIDFCCKGKMSLDQACATSGAPLPRVLEELEKASTAATAEGQQSWQNATTQQLVDRIVQHHHQYVTNECARLLPLLEKIARVHGQRHPELAQVREQFLELAKEMQTHQLKEEQVLFPHILRMDEAASHGATVPQAFFGNVHRPIRHMMQDHDDAGAILTTLRQLTNDYTPPADGCASYRAAFLGLAEFEEDLHVHIHLENNVLFPRAAAWEPEEVSAEAGSCCH